VTPVIVTGTDVPPWYGQQADGTLEPPPAGDVFFAPFV